MYVHDEMRSLIDTVRHDKRRVLWLVRCIIRLNVKKRTGQQSMQVPEITNCEMGKLMKITHTCTWFFIACAFKTSFLMVI